MHDGEKKEEGEDEGMCEACGEKMEDCKCNKPAEGSGPMKPGHMTLKIQIIMEKPDAELEEGDVEELMKHASKDHQSRKFGKSKKEFGEKDAI